MKCDFIPGRFLTKIIRIEQASDDKKKYRKIKSALNNAPTKTKIFGPVRLENYFIFSGLRG